MINIHSIIIMVLAFILSLNACKSKVSIGVKKDFNTGLSATYKNMEPDKVFLVMNNEILHHTDIPLGESFLLVNDGIDGAIVKNGQVSIGCSLKITDNKGDILLDEKDLFEGRDLFNEAEAQMLKCTINTGAPMKWDEKYDVYVIFWDKNGAGKIENNVTIKMIDIP